MSARALHWRRPALIVGLYLHVLCGSAAWANQDPDATAALQQQADRWLRRGFDQPAAALDAISQSLAAAGAEASHVRILQRTRGMVAARAGRDAEADSAMAALAALGAVGDALARRTRS